VAAVEEPRYMDRPRQRTECSAQQHWPYHYGLTAFLGLSFLLFFAGCAQLDQLMGKQAASAESQPTAQGKDPAAKQATTKKTDEAPSPGVAKEPPQRASSTTAAHPSAPTAGTAKQTDQEKALAEKKEKKSHVASDKKSTKKLPHSQAEPQPPTEDVFLSPIPLPSKPAAIGGSGG
jgi:hypothetical protein